MYTLHKLKAARKRREPDALDGSTFVDARTALPEGPEPDITPVHPEAAEDGTHPWGFDREDLERFPALKRRNFWCVQRHQARGEPRPAR